MDIYRSVKELYDAIIKLDGTPKNEDNTDKVDTVALTEIINTNHIISTTENDDGLVYDKVLDNNKLDTGKLKDLITKGQKWEEIKQITNIPKNNGEIDIPELTKIITT
jgi:hypothetical protein